MPTANQLAQGFVQHFWAADHAIEWLAAEQEHQVELAPGVLLVGRIDAIGRDAEGQTFFGEWKTASPRGRATWKQVWRMNPQTLTYGILAEDWIRSYWGDVMPAKAGRRFTVRKAFKSEPPTFDHAWYSYSQDELVHWRLQLMQVAHEIRAYHKAIYSSPPIPLVEPWPTNFGACFKYGPNYVCPFFDQYCSKVNFASIQLGPLNAQFVAREPHLEGERRLNATNGSVVVLDATRIATWFECRERYRREYVENVMAPPSEAMRLGLDFHAALGEYYRGLIPKQETVNG